MAPTNRGNIERSPADSLEPRGSGPAATRGLRATPVPERALSRQELQRLQPFEGDLAPPQGQIPVPEDLRDLDRFVPVIGKKPIGKGWQSRRQTLQQAQATPGATGVGLNIGGVDSPLVALDVDYPDQLAPWLEQHGITLPATLEISRTGANGRRKLLFWTPEGFTWDDVSKKHAWGELFVPTNSSRGHQIVVAGDHPDGGHYHHNAAPIAVLPIAAAQAIATAARKPQPCTVTATTRADAAEHRRILELRYCLTTSNRKLLDTLEPGGRDDGLFRLAADAVSITEALACLGVGVTPSPLELLQEVAQACNNRHPDADPITERLVSEKVRRAAGSQPTTGWVRRVIKGIFDKRLAELLEQAPVPDGLPQQYSLNCPDDPLIAQFAAELGAGLATQANKSPKTGEITSRSWTHHRVCAPVAQNVFTGIGLRRDVRGIAASCWDDRAVPEPTYTTLAAVVEALGWQPAPPERLQQHAAAVAASHVFDPAAEELLALEANPGVIADPDNLGRLGQRLFGLEADPLADHAFRSVVLQYVARVLRPGCLVNRHLLLKGPQGAGKSEFCRWLAGSPLRHTTASADASGFGKDELLKFSRFPVVELDEFEAHTGRKAAGAIKSFLTSTSDSVRPAYAREPVLIPRNYVTVITANHAALTEAQNRRYWPVELPHAGADSHQFRLEWARENRSALLKAAVLELRAAWAADPEATPWDTVPVTLRPLLDRAADDQRAGDVWEDALEAFLVPGRSTEWVSSRELMTQLQNLDLLGTSPSRADQMRLGNAMEALGWVKERRRTPHGRGWGWKLARPGPTLAQPSAEVGPGRSLGAEGESRVAQPGPTFFLNKKRTKELTTDRGFRHQRSPA